MKGNTLQISIHFSNKLVSNPNVKLFWFLFLFSFFEVASNWDTRNQPCWPNALFLLFEFIVGYPAVQPLYRGAQYCSVAPLLFDLDSSWQSWRSASLSFLTPGIHIECVPTFPSLHYISGTRDSLLSSSCAAYNADWYARLEALPTFCNVSCPVYSLSEHSHRLVPPEIIGWSHTFHRPPFHLFPFSCSIYYFGLNLLEDSCREGSKLIGLVPTPSLASLSVVSFYRMPPCSGIHIIVTWFTSNSAVSFSTKSTISSDFVPLTPRTATVTWLSVQIVVCSFTNLSLSQLVTHSPVLPQLLPDRP